MSCDAAAHERTARLVNDVFAPDPPVTGSDLHWYYCENPRGAASVGRVETGDQRLGNYALVPQDFEMNARTVRLGLGVDLAVSPASRGSGAFRRTVEDSYERGTADGLDGILGVANANSAPRMVEAMGWRQMDPFPVKLVLPGKTAPLQSEPVTPAWLASSSASVLNDVAHRQTGHGFTPRWDEAYLRWRLARPGRSYVVHHGDSMVAVSTTTTIARVRIAVLLKMFTSSEPLSGSRLAGTLASHHRTPFVLYWGANASVPIRGIPLPQKLMPSPLQLVLHRFNQGWDREAFELSTFEFLDFDGF